MPIVPLWACQCEEKNSCDCSSKYTSDHYLKEYSKKFPILLEHYGLSLDCAHVKDQLLMLLLMNHVPGFQPVYPDPTPSKKVGQPPVWKQSGGIQLYLDVQKKVREGKGILPACKVLASEDRYKGNKPENIKRRYYEILEELGDVKQKHINTLIANLPEEYCNRLLTAYSPDGNALFKNIEILECFANLYSQAKK